MRFRFSNKMFQVPGVGVGVFIWISSIFAPFLLFFSLPNPQFYVFGFYLISVLLLHSSFFNFIWNIFISIFSDFFSLHFLHFHLSLSSLVYSKVSSCDLFMLGLGRAFSFISFNMHMYSYYVVCVGLLLSSSLSFSLFVFAIFIFCSFLPAIQFSWCSVTSFQGLSKWTAQFLLFQLFSPAVLKYTRWKRHWFRKKVDNQLNSLKWWTLNGSLHFAIHFVRNL